MERNRIIELLTRKLAGEATKHELEELHDLIDRYPDSVYYEEGLKALWLPASEDIDTDQAFKNHLSKFQGELNFEEETESMLSPGFFSRYKRYAVACSILLISGLAYLFLSDLAKPDTEILHTQIVAGKGIRKKVTLPDGTLVWLNADSKLSFDLNMKEKDQRLVTLSGEAFFEVAHDKKHPFIVHTDKISVKVLGTSFNIKAYPKEKKAETTLIKGSVELHVNGDTPQTFVLRPSEKFILEDKEIQAVKFKTLQPDKGRMLLLENIDPILMGNKTYIEETSWTENRLVFRNETFLELVPKLERWFNVSIQIKDERTKSYRFTVIFTKETINQALAAMQLTQPFHFKLKNHDVIIYE